MGNLKFVNKRLFILEVFNLYFRSTNLLATTIQTKNAHVNVMLVTNCPIARNHPDRTIVMDTVVVGVVCCVDSTLKKWVVLDMFKPGYLGLEVNCT